MEPLSIDSPPSDRRVSPRLPVTAGCRLRSDMWGGSIACQTLDASAGGLLLHATGPRAAHIRPGDAVRVVVDWDGQGLVNQTSLRSATILRASPHDDGSVRLAMAFRAIQVAQRPHAA